MQGDSDSQYCLGRCYEDGIGVDVDLNEAREWYARAAQQGNKDSKRALKRLK